MSFNPSCNLDPLDPYIPTPENPWNVSKINHLYRRAAFGAKKNDVTDALAQNDPSALVDMLVDEAISAIPTPDPSWGYWTGDNFENAPEEMSHYIAEGKKMMFNDFTNHKLRDRLSLFWSNHFVTEDDEYRSAAYQYQYYNLLQFHAIGNFKDFVHDIGISAPMLVYLNGDQNINDRPNENYARELYELFTLGINNGYNEDDIIETSKALTGWVNTNDISLGPITFDPEKFSNETKSIFGQTGNWGYSDVIDILFEQRTDKIATFICSKLYRYFVSPVIQDDIIAGMAQTFITNNFEIGPVLRQLFKSQHFFNQYAFSVIIKSPIDLLVTNYNETDFTLPADLDYLNYFRNTSRVLGQDVFNPIDVAGWQGDSDWISPDLLIGRWDGIRYLINRSWQHNEIQFKNFLIGLPIGTAAEGVLATTTDDVILVVRAITNYFFAKGVEDPIIFNELLGVFKGDSVPENYYEDGTWTLDYPGVEQQLYNLLLYISEIPEFQLK
ncbi:DUF1800 domain-containing protein [Aquimarina sp. TRL1]|uniref:DUF1800 domain-containing protein n=1 Tax=Aquimarina sp. (strain TRL1) TaxID=2736252 RepID=UPI0015888755|nr:DUF1800 domain-containing protein [Aquimarina sp. TRL1]QKX04944.1 DUF1800 domain-containing protein [Aquimarina sp. TRL1]